MVRPTYILQYFWYYSGQSFGESVLEICNQKKKKEKRITLSQKTPEEGDLFICSVIELLLLNPRGRRRRQDYFGPSARWTAERAGVAKNSLRGVKGAQRDRV